MKTTLGKGGIHHIGFVVNNFDKTVKHFESFYGITDFQIYHFQPNRAWAFGEELSECRMKIGMGKFGPNKTNFIEIIKPMVGQGIHKKFLDEGNHGLHHICFPVDNYDEAKAYFKEKGVEYIFECETEDEIIGYRRGSFAFDPVAGMIFEIKENPYFRNK